MRLGEVVVTTTKAVKTRPKLKTPMIWMARVLTPPNGGQQTSPRNRYRERGDRELTGASGGNDQGRQGSTATGNANCLEGRSTQSPLTEVRKALWTHMQLVSERRRRAGC